jgi:hypothetical protein
VSFLRNAKVRSRQISDADIPKVVELLAKGFPRRNQQYWLNALERLGRFASPTGYPKYGYLMEDDEVLVGVKLMIFCKVQPDNDVVRCNVSSWFVEPQFRSHATFLVSKVLNQKDVTFLNISPASHVRPIIEAQGFTRYSSGQFVTLPTIRRVAHDCQSIESAVDSTPDVHFEQFERELLLAHAEYGCVSLWCMTHDRAYPFVFIPRIVKGFVPCVQLIYCRNIHDFVRFARPLELFFASRGRPFIIVDSNGPINGLTGFYFDGVSPKYFKGRERPRLGDLAYTEAALFGL